MIALGGAEAECDLYPHGGSERKQGGRILNRQDGVRQPVARQPEELSMTKAELIEDVSQTVEMSRKDSEIIVETIFESIVKSLRAGDKIEIRGYGSFRTRQRKSRIGRNPKTGSRVDVPAKKIPYFKPSKELKDLVNGVTTMEAGAPTPAPATSETPEATTPPPTSAPTA
jgi:integration host factor subunit beta